MPRIECSMMTPLARWYILSVCLCNVLVIEGEESIQTVCQHANKEHMDKRREECHRNTSEYTSQTLPEECRNMPRFDPILGIITGQPHAHSITALACDIEEITLDGVRARLHNVLGLLNRCKEAQMPLFGYLACCQADEAEPIPKTALIEANKLALEFLLSTAEGAGEKYCGELVLDCEIQKTEDTLKTMHFCLLLGDFQEGCDWLEKRRPSFEGCGPFLKGFFPKYGGCVKSLGTYTRKLLKSSQQMGPDGLLEMGYTKRVLPEELKPQITKALDSEPSSICGVSLPGSYSSAHMDLLIDSGSECPNPLGDAITVIKEWKQERQSGGGIVVIMLVVVVIVCFSVVVLLLARGRYSSLLMGVFGGAREIDDKAIELASTTKCTTDAPPRF